VEEIKVYLEGGAGIKNPVDLNGNIISEGDILTWDYGDYETIGLKVRKEWLTEPFYKVKVHDSGIFYAESIEPVGSVAIDGDKRYYYLHDFRFKFCVKL